LLIAFNLAAFADDSLPAATQPSAAAAPESNWTERKSSESNKQQYNLLNPTPADQLRGMDTDRPNVTNTPHTIDAGHLQIEVGVVDYSYFRDRSRGDNVREDDVGVGQFNFRLGVLNDLEINAVLDGYDFVERHDYDAGVSVHAGGFGDTVVGGKLNLWGDESGGDGTGDDGTWETAMAIQPQFKIPTARDDVGNGHFEFEVGVPFLMNLPEDFHLGAQAGVSHERSADDGGYVTGFPMSVSVDRVVVGNLDVYLEYACDPTTEKHVETVQTIDVGGTYPLTDNLVLDGGVNFGLNRASNNVEVLAGISVRF
jgi:hypothetical protein